MISISEARNPDHRVTCCFPWDTVSKPLLESVPSDEDSRYRGRGGPVSHWPRYDHVGIGERFRRGLGAATGRRAFQRCGAPSSATMAAGVRVTGFGDPGEIV